MGSQSMDIGPRFSAPGSIPRNGRLVVVRDQPIHNLPKNGTEMSALCMEKSHCT